MTNEEYKQLHDILNMVKKVIDYLEKQEDYFSFNVKSLLEDLKNTVKEVNKELFDSELVNFCDMNYLLGRSEVDENSNRSVEQYKLWIKVVEEVIERRYGAKNLWDERFFRLMDYVEFVEQETIVENAKRCLWNLEEEQRMRLNLYYQNFQDMWGRLDTDNEVYDVINNRVSVLVEHRKDFLWLYDRLGDYRSKLVLCCILYNWVTFDWNCISTMKEGNYVDYFDLDLVECNEEEVFVDLGAYTGDSVLDFINIYRKYKKIYCYEITENTVQIMKENLNGYGSIEYRNKGAGARNGKMYIQEMSSDVSCNKIEEKKTGKEIEVVTLDDDIEEKVTLIKMDIEGAEQDALRGARRHIIEEHPKLLISVYHNNEDIWKIPKMIVEMNNDYRFYLRSNGRQWGPSEIVLFAL